MRPLTGYFFEDYSLGQAFVHPTPRTITQGDVAIYQGLTGSRNPLHCSQPYAMSLGYPSMPVDDLLVFHVAFGKTVHDISYNAVANLGYADCRFLQPVFIGDTIRAESEVIGLRENSSGKTGIVYVRSDAFNQHGEPVLTWIRWVMVHRRAPTNKPARAPTGIENVPGEVAAKDFALPAGLKPAVNMASVTGSRRYWEDYAAIDPTHREKSPGKSVVMTAEIIKHPAGMTIDETDHTLATKLYQNTARVHVDLHHMKDSRFGRRLVYGGHVMSICRALSFDGLENAQSILAIHGGTHHNPTFAGDTLYAVSVPTFKTPINKHFGALRVSLSGYKNIDPNDPAFNEETAKELKVLSLDYTVLMPRR